MSHNLRALFTISLAISAFSSAAYAAPLPIRPGLYQEDVSVQRAGRPALTVPTKVCITENSLEKIRFYEIVKRMKDGKTCHLDRFEEGGKTVSASWHCAGTSASANGEGQLTFEDDTHFHFSTTEHTTSGEVTIDTIVKVQAHMVADACADSK